MEQIFKKAALTLLSEQCYKEFFQDFNFFNIICLKALIIKCLGYAVISGSLCVKVPQIIKIWNNRSAKGVSFVNVLSDVFAITTNTSYSFVRAFPFSAYGEGLFMGIQTLIIAAQVLHYNYSTIAASTFVAFYSVICYVLTSGLVPVNVLWSLQGMSLPIILFGKSVQAFANYKNKGTGQLSAITCSMLLFGSISRIITSIEETGDKLSILTYSLATLGNAVIVTQFIYYRKPQGGASKKKEGKKSQ